MQKIYIVEDDDNLRELVCYALATAGFDAVGFSEPASFWVEMETNNAVDLLLLDIMLPVEDGISILYKLKHADKTKTLPVVMLTAKGKELDRVKGLDLGADDYITKPFSVLELISRVKAVLRRCSIKSDMPLLIKSGEIYVNTEKRSVVVADKQISLTYKEFELLHYFLLNEGLVLSRDKLMDKIWGIDYEGESRTVDMHVKALRQKLGISGIAIKTVRGIGYKLEGES